MGREERAQYGLVDLAKFLCSLLVVAAHFITERSGGRMTALLEYGISVYVIVVPFFFGVSGYFLFSKVFSQENRGKELIFGYVKRTVIMYLGWSVIYVAFQVLTWLRFGVTGTEVVKYLLNAVFYSTYNTIWFLPALCIGILLTWGLYRKLGMKKTLILSLAFYAVGALGVSYSFLFAGSKPLSMVLEGYEWVFVSTRNGFFNGFPFVALGAFIAWEDHKGLKKPAIGRNLVPAAILGVGFVAEALVLKLVFDAVNVNTLVLLIPFTYYFIRFLFSVPLKTGKTLRWMRRMSTSIFLCQRIYLTALPVLLPGSVFERMLVGNPYVGLLYSLLIVCATAALIVQASGRIKALRVLC